MNATIILLKLCIALLSCYVFGYGLTKLTRMPRAVAVPVGYALTQVLYFVAYMVLLNPTAAFVVAVVIPTATTLYTFGHKARFSCMEEPKSARWPALLLGMVTVIIVSAWPYLAAAPGNYWHSGNEDFFDANNGRNAFLQKDAAVLEYDFAVVHQNSVLSTTLAADAPQFSTPSDRDRTVAAKGLADVYAVDLGRLQYSSLAFWSTLLHANSDLDAWMIQSILNLLLMMHGLMLLLSVILPVSPTAALTISVACILDNFYLTTFINGHQGSLMFAAIAPYVIWACIKIAEPARTVSERTNIAKFVAVLTAFLAGVYPYPFFIGFAILLFWGITYSWTLPRNYRIWLLVGFVAAVALFYLASWNSFSPFRQKTIELYRTWGTVFTYIGLFQFWGIWPSFLASSSPTILLNLIQSKLATFGSYFIVGLLCGLALYGLYRSFKHGMLFFGAFALMFLTSLPLFLLSVHDSYYFYKFLYLTNFGIVALMLFGAREVFVGRVPKLVKAAVAAVLAVWVVCNAGSNLWATTMIRDLSFNKQTDEYRSVVGLFQTGHPVYIDLPRRGTRGAHLSADENIIRNYLTDAGIAYTADPQRAEYFLRMNGQSDAVLPAKEEVVWHNNLFRLVKAPPSDVLLVGSFWAPETMAGPDAQPFRWVDDQVNNWVAIDIIRRAAESRFLFFCVEPGPGVDHRLIPIRITDKNKTQLMVEMADSFSCYWADIADSRLPLTITSSAKGKAVSRIDTRHLNFRISNIGLFSVKHSLDTLRALNIENDITPQTTALALKTLTPSDSGNVFLLNGWYAVESAGQQTFRWARNGARILLESPEPGILSMELEPGPSLGIPNPEFTIRLEGGPPLQVVKSPSRSSVIDIPVTPDKTGRSIIQVDVNTAKRPVLNDWRQLDFRVFKIGWKTAKAD